MVNYLDPVLHRLVEVNPAPEDFELPPISDKARLEAILERGRSERLRSLPVQLQSWRPGLVIAAAAFVTVVVIAAVMTLLTGIPAEEEGPVVTEPPVVTTVAPIPTTVPPSINQYEVTISDLDGESFSASGPAVDARVACGEGTIDMITISKQPLTSRMPLGGEYSDHYNSVEEHTLTCGDGSGVIVLGVRINQAQLMSRYSFTGEWAVVTGTGDYERVAGGGDFEGRCDSDRSNCNYEYTGRLDLSHDLGTGPTVTALIGRHDVAITFEGKWTTGRFNATGSAATSGLMCPDGTMMGISETLNGIGEWEHTLFCAKRTGRMTLAIDARESTFEGRVFHTGTWTVIGGAGAYESVAGVGEFSGECLDGRHCSWKYTGHLEVSE